MIINDNTNASTFDHPKTYDLIKWYVPILNCLPNKHKYQLGSRTTDTLYNLLKGLLEAKYSHSNQTKLKTLNLSLDILRYQTRLLFDFAQLSIERYAYVRYKPLA